MSHFLEQLFNALVIGSFYALVALGYSMVYGIIRLINFAHGDLYMIGAFIGYSVLLLLGKVTGNAGVVGILLALVLAMGAVGGMGFLIERLAYRPLRGSPKIILLITALGMSLALEYGTMVFKPWGSSFRVYPVTLGEAGFGLAGVHVSFANLAIFLVALALMIGLNLFVEKTIMGKAMRAVAFDRETAQLMGINIDKTISIGFFLGAALAGAAGVMAGLKYGQVNFLMGFIIGLKAFTASVMGGIGNLPGAMVGGMLLGVLEVFGTQAVGGQWKDVFAFGALILILVFKPTGLLGEKTAGRM
ncbi:MAG TPA: branched-chain amino acid ABC transporter permease [Symbiobacteriaceae bacterium]|nr:branched-chain amino acid ABC transporter permease [Symbiobacteriaceae bacterium]